MSIRRLGIVTALWGLVLTAAPAIANDWPDILLFWTSPTDNGVRGGAVAYDMRWASVPITEQNFALCPKLPNPTVAVGPGNLQVYAVKGFDPMGIYFFALKSVDDRGNWSALSNVVIHTPDDVLAVDRDPSRLLFSPPWPNPARGSTRFAFTLAEPGRMKVEAFDIGGRHVRTIRDTDMPAGPSGLDWDLRDDAGQPVTPGLYLVRATLGGRVLTRRVTVTR